MNGETRSEFVWLRSAEEQVVRTCASFACTRPARVVAASLTRLGNGSLYPLLAVAIWGLQGRAALQPLIAAGLSMAIAQAVLRASKRLGRRRRPYEVLPETPSLARVQDANSFPSGHLMTLTAASVPVLIVFPAWIWLLAPLWGLMAWSRMACGHHYPSDVLTGAALGCAVGYLVSAGVLA
jgi:undecaprenyl-diphosphatase